MQMLQRVQEDECLWYHDLCSALGAAGAMLKPLQCTLQPIAPAVDFVTGCTVDDFLQYFLSTKTSALFSAVLAMYCQPESQCALEEMVSKLQASHTFMCSILLSEVSVKSLHLISKQIGRADMKADLANLSSFPAYSPLLDSRGAEDLFATIEQLLLVMMYLSWAPTILDVFQTNGIIVASGKSSDEDIKTIHDLLSMSLGDVCLKDMVKSLTQVANLFKDFNQIHFDLVTEVNKQGDLIKLLKERKVFY